MNYGIEKILEIAAPWINGGLFLTLIVLLFNKRKTNAEADKLDTESHQISSDIEIRLVEFYQSQVSSLTEKYEELKAKFDRKEEEHMNCEERICELEEKYNILTKEIKQLKK